MNTAIFFAKMNCCGMSGMYGTDRIHIEPFSIGRRYVPFRAEKRLLRCTRAHALRWQITPLWGWIHLNLQVEIEWDCPQDTDADPLYEKTGCAYNDASVLGVAAIILNGDIDIAADASPSGTVHACSPVPGLTPFAGRLRPVGAGCI